MGYREILIHLAALSMLVSACTAEDSVNPPPSNPTASNGSTMGGRSNPMGGSGPAGIGGGGKSGVPMAGSSGASASAGAGTGTATGGTTAGSGGIGAGGMAGTEPMGGGAGAAGGTGGSSAAQDADCDMNGLWIARMLTVTDALSADQCASIYGFYELKQEGANVEVVNHFDCGLIARGSATASYGTTTREALLTVNSQIGRKGTMTKGADGTCHLDMEPFWYVLGAEASFAPSPRNSPQTLPQVQAANPLPMQKDAAGIMDLENDGKPGYTTVVTESPVPGVRRGVIRNTHTWKTDDFYKITPSMSWDSNIEARVAYFGEEYALEADNDFLLSLATPVPLADAARVTLRFLGRDASAERAQQIVVSADPTDHAGALKTCDNIIAALPKIDPDYGLEQRCPCPNGQPADTARKCAR